MSDRADRYPLFDSLRALAALSILVLHGTSRAGVLQHPLAGVPHALLANLYLGLIVFFVISGFLLYRPFARANLRDEPLPSAWHYALRRVLRIVPAYWLALTVAALALGDGYVFRAPDAPILYGFGQIYSGRTTFLGIGAAWSLCVEVTFYAFLPLFALAMAALPGGTRERRLRNELAGLCALAVVAIVWTAWAMARSDFNAPGAQPLLDVLPAYLDTFAIGMALAVLSVRLAEREVAPAVIRVVDRRPGLAWMTAFALWGLSIWVAPDPGYTPMTRVQYLAKHVLLGLAAAAVLLPAIVGDPARGAVRKLLGNRVLLWLGLISYGVYLYHQPAYALLARAPDLAGGHPVVDVGIRVVAAFAMSVALAALSYYLMERPVMRLRRLFEGRAPRRQDQPGAASVPARSAVR